VTEPTNSDLHAQAAREAGLRYVTDASPGIHRRSRGEHFHYEAADGGRVKDSETLSRIKSLVVPPAWRDVHIATSPRSAIQAWGFDARGRKQYRYHERAVERRELRKYHRVRQLAKELPRLRGTLHDDARPNARANTLDADTVAATVLRLISETFCRIGGERYAKENGTFGITTLKKSHVGVRNRIVTFAYKGKSNIRQRQVVTDPQLVRLVQRQLRTPGSKLFSYVRKARWQVITAREVNDYLQRHAGGYSAKDFRTWGGTLRAATVLAELGAANSDAEAKRNVVQAIASVAKRLGNTKSVCRKCYIHPAILAAYMDGKPMASDEAGVATMIGRKRGRESFSSSAA
jgi:DNA topoisomerase-1